MGRTPPSGSAGVPGESYRLPGLYRAYVLGREAAKARAATGVDYRDPRADDPDDWTQFDAVLAEARAIAEVAAEAEIARGEPITTDLAPLTYIGPWWWWPLSVRIVIPRGVEFFRDSSRVFNFGPDDVLTVNVEATAKRKVWLAERQEQLRASVVRRQAARQAAARAAVSHGAIEHNGHQVVDLD